MNVPDGVDRVVSVKEAAAVLGVSDATVRNWIKAGLLVNLAGPGRYAIAKNEVARFLTRLRQEGRNGKLRSRANKTFSREHRPPLRRAGSRADRQLSSLAARMRAARLDPARALPLTAIAWVRARGLFGASSLDRLAAARPPGKDDNHLFRELYAFCAPLREQPPSPETKRLLASLPPDVDDILGLLYQALLTEGARAAQGVYYTAPLIAADVADAIFRRGDSILDPCCGSGAFLVAFAKAGAPPEALHGYDRDPLAVGIARLNLLVHWPNHDFSRQIVRRDALSPARDGNGGTEAGTFDIIATNPPWGARMEPSRLEALRAAYPEIVSRESFSFFLRRSIDMLAPGGRGCFILPEAFRSTAKHRDIRNVLADRTRVDRIAPLERIFGEVFTPALRLDFTVLPGKTNSGGTARFFIAGGDKDARPAEKMLRTPGVFLTGNAEWALGIVTGDNRRHLSNRPAPGLEPVFRGRDVTPFRFARPSVHLRFQPDLFQQTAPEAKYRSAEKLVYRFISKRLVFAVDRERRLTLNSANVVIPRLTSHSPAVIAALFNSAPYQYLYATLFPGLKVLRSHLERLPLPLWDGKTLAALAGMAEDLAEGKGDPEELDDLVAGAFGLTAGERAALAAFAAAGTGKRNKYYGNARS